MKYCLICGKSCEDSDLSCPYCGYHLSSGSEKPRICPSCKNTNSHDSAFCTKCGTKLVLDKSPELSVKSISREKLFANQNIKLFSSVWVLIIAVTYTLFLLRSVLSSDYLFEELVSPLRSKLHDCFTSSTAEVWEIMSVLIDIADVVSICIRFAILIGIWAAYIFALISKNLNFAKIGLRIIRTCSFIIQIMLCLFFGLFVIFMLIDFANQSSPDASFLIEFIKTSALIILLIVFHTKLDASICAVYYNIDIYRSLKGISYFSGVFCFILGTMLVYTTGMDYAFYSGSFWLCLTLFTTGAFLFFYQAKLLNMHFDKEF